MQGRASRNPRISPFHAILALASQHRHEPHNNWDTEFDFTDANYERVRRQLPPKLAPASSS
jgi:hypothetical protein